MFCRQCEQRVDLCRCTYKHEFKTRISTEIPQLTQEEQENIVVSWIEDKLGREKEGSFEQWISSGVVLCTLVNTVDSKPLIKIISESELPKEQRQNIICFLHHCVTTFQMTEDEVFTVDELCEKKSMDKVVACLLHLKDRMEQPEFHESDSKEELRLFPIKRKKFSLTGMTKFLIPPHGDHYSAKETN